MSNCQISFYNRTDTSTLAGGSWSASLPLSNLKTRLLGQVARSTNLLTTSTQFTADIGPDHIVRTFGFSNHNLSFSALYRVRGYSDAGYTTLVYDSGWEEAWPPVYGATRDWQSPNFWNGKYLPEEIAGITPLITVSMPLSLNNRYWKFDFDDTTNTAGYIQIGRLFIADAWQPTYNMKYGAGIGWETDTDVQKALSGAEYFDERTPGRYVQFEIPAMSEEEAFDNAFEIQRRSGISKEVLFQWDPDDPSQALRKSFLGRLRRLSPIEYPDAYVDRRISAWEIKELLP